VGGDREPTPRAGACIEDTGLIGPESLEWLHRLLYESEHNLVDLIVCDDGSVRVAFRVFVGLDCLEPVEARVTACGPGAERLLALVDEPEVGAAEVERGCVTLVAPFDTPVRVARLLGKLGITGPLAVLDYAPAE